MSVERRESRHVGEIVMDHFDRVCRERDQIRRERDDARRAQCVLQQRWMVTSQKVSIPLRAIAADIWGDEVANALWASEPECGADVQ